MEREPAKEYKNLRVVVKCVDCGWVYSIPASKENLEGKIEYMSELAYVHEDLTFHRVNVGVVKQR